MTDEQPTARVTDVMLERYLAGDLAPAQRARIEVILGADAQVRGRLEALRGERDAFLRSAPAEAFAHRLATRLSVASGAERVPKGPGWRVWLLAPSLGAAMALVLGVVYQQRFGGEAVVMEERARFDDEAPVAQDQTGAANAAPEQQGDAAAGAPSAEAPLGARGAAPSVVAPPPPGSAAPAASTAADDDGWREGSSDKRRAARQGPSRERDALGDRSFGEGGGGVGGLGATGKGAGGGGYGGGVGAIGQGAGRSADRDAASERKRDAQKEAPAPERSARAFAKPPVPRPAPGSAGPETASKRKSEAARERDELDGAPSSPSPVVTEERSAAQPRDEADAGRDAEAPRDAAAPGPYAPSPRQESAGHTSHSAAPPAPAKSASPPAPHERAADAASASEKATSRAPSSLSVNVVVGQGSQARPLRAADPLAGGTRLAVWVSVPTEHHVAIVSVRRGAAPLVVGQRRVAPGAPVAFPVSVRPTAVRVAEALFVVVSTTPIDPATLRPAGANKDALELPLRLETPATQRRWTITVVP